MVDIGISDLTCSEVNVNILIWLVAKIANFHTVFITNLQGLL